MVGSLWDEVFSLNTPDGWQYTWNVTHGRRIAEARGELTFFSPKQWDITPAAVLEMYCDLDADYAMTTDLSKPLLFLVFHGKPQLADGWHRLYKAAVLGVETVPAYLLTEEEGESILMLSLPPGHAMSLGSSACASTM
jgi:hypothetical protein